jgi:glycerol-3-phosphate dehydrogenase subunit B
MNFASGIMDLMGVHPAGRQWDDPWKAIDQVRCDLPDHPFAKIENSLIDRGLAEVSNFLEDKLPYQRSMGTNVTLVTSVGTLKKTHMVPKTMWNGVKALEEKAPTLILDFTGMKLFSARQIASSLGKVWPGIRSRTIDFPRSELLEELHPEHAARSLDLSGNRIELAKRIKPLVKDAEYIGFPALVGMYHSVEAVAELERLLERPIFEIPTPPVSVPGIRLQEAMINGLEASSEFHSFSNMAIDATKVPGKGFVTTIKGSNGNRTIVSKAVLLATGRFLGKGLVADRRGIFEALMNLFVVQPESREGWHRTSLFDPKGHPVNRAGIQTDSTFKPLTAQGEPVMDNLYVAGSILAGSDWMRMKCGSGVAIATALAAVKAIEVSGIGK